MRTFEEIKKNELYRQNSLISRCSERLNEGGLRDFEERAMTMVIDDSQSYIDNIDEVAKIKIGATTNSLIKAIQTAYKIHLNEYWQDFEGFVDEHVVGMTPDGKLKNGIYFGQSECLTLGIGVDDLSCFKGCNPMSDEVCDVFRRSINDNYGTNIPMAGVEEAALQEYEEVAFTGDEEAKDNAFTHLKEVQRDSGTLMNGGTYYLLATNQQYQEAKDRCAGRVI